MSPSGLALAHGGTCLGESTRVFAGTGLAMQTIMQLALLRGGARTAALVLALSAGLMAVPGRGQRAELFALLAFIVLKSLAQARWQRAGRPAVQ